MQIALAGNPNSGKTSLFNVLTGSRQHVGNWPGVTVEQKSGPVTVQGKEHLLIDLPGIYTMDPDTIEQKVTRDYIVTQHPDLIINIIDATNLQRSLYFTLQLRESGVPVVAALNMMDEVEKSGVKINTDTLSKILGMPVVGISAAKGTGIQELLAVIGRFDKKEITISPLCTGCESCSRCRSGEFRYKFIDSIIAQCVTAPSEKRKSEISEKIDRVVLNKYLAFPIFLVVVLLMFTLTFGGLVSWASQGISWLLGDVAGGALTAGLTSAHAPAWVISLLTNGILSGIGTVLSFLPQITVLFILMSLLEDSGYMARAAVMMDRFFSAFGLSGSSFIPLIMGFGCAVPAVMACRILPSEKDRKLTIMLTSFVSCSARLPLYALLAGVFFTQFQGVVVLSIYLLGIVVAVLAVLILNKTVFHRKNDTFVMELPPYRVPQPRNLLLHTWERVRDFLVRAGTILLIASVIVWLLQSYTPGFAPAASPSDSIWAMIGRFITPLFAPLGFGGWIPATALITGIPSKEMVVSTLSVLTGSAGRTAVLHQALAHIFTPLSAYCFMAFALLYTPCISTIAAMRHEFGSIKWTVGTVLFDFSMAWVITFLIYHVGLLLGL